MSANDQSNATDQENEVVKAGLRLQALIHLERVVRDIMERLNEEHGDDDDFGAAVIFPLMDALSAIDFIDAINLEELTDVLREKAVDSY